MWFRFYFTWIKIKEIYSFSIFSIIQGPSWQTVFYFSTSKNLKNHMIMIHGESTQFKCEICDKRMPNGGKLKDHVKTVHTKVTCEICHQVQYNWYYLKRHKTSAHGIVPNGYSKCPHCELVFRQNASLLKHIDTKHKWKCDLNFISHE